MPIPSQAFLSHGSLAARRRVASTATDDFSTGVLPGSFALAFLDLVFRPTFP
jgi:hypothetical protein